MNLPPRTLALQPGTIVAICALAMMFGIAANARPTLGVCAYPAPSDDDRVVSIDYGFFGLHGTTLGDGTAGTIAKFGPFKPTVPLGPTATLLTFIGLFSTGVALFICHIWLRVQQRRDARWRKQAESDRERRLLSRQGRPVQ